MEKVYQVTFMLNNQTYPILFDNQDTAERIITAINAILTDQGREKLKYECEIINVHSRKDVLDIARIMFN